MTTFPVGAASPLPTGRTPVPCETSELALRYGHDRLPFGKYDRSGIVYAIKPPPALSLQADPDPLAPSFEQITYHRHRAACRFDTWGIWTWDVYVANEWLWVAPNKAQYRPNPHVPRPAFATAPLATMPD